MSNDTNTFSTDDDDAEAGSVFNPKDPRPGEDVHGERRSITAIGRKDHIYRSSVPESNKPKPAPVPSVQSKPKEENVPSRSDRETQAEQSFTGYLEVEKKKESVTQAVVLKVVLFLIAAGVLSVGLAVVILNLLQK